MPFAAYPSAVVFKEPGKTVVRQVIWGDLIEVNGLRRGHWVEVHARGENG